MGLEKFKNIPTADEVEEERNKRTENKGSYSTTDHEKEDSRNRFVQELKTVSKEEGIEVLQNLEINDKNLELTVKMALIEEEMKKREIVLKADKDTGEVKKGTNEFSELKKDTLKETKKELTKPSKYIKGAVIAGLVAIGLYADQEFYGPIQQAISNIEALDVAEFCTMVAAAGATLIEIGFAIKQEIKSKKVTNQKVQRILGMMGLGMEKEKAQDVVGMEASAKKKEMSGYHWAGERTRNWGHRSIEEIEKIKTTRETLDEMGIKRVSREKNQG